MQPWPLRTTVIGSYPFPGWLEFAAQNLIQQHMPELTRVFTSGPYRIYQVDQSKLPAPEATVQ